MSQALITEQYLTNIADAIRDKLEVQTEYLPSQMAGAIETMHGILKTETLSTTANGTFTPSAGKDGFSEVTVAVPAGGNLISKTITANGTYHSSDDNADGYDEVVVNVLSMIEEWDFTSETPLVGKVREFTMTQGNVTFNNGAVFDVTNGYLKAGAYASFYGVTIEVDVASMNLTSGTHRRFIMPNISDGFIYRSTGVWAMYWGSSGWEESTETDGSFFDNSTIKIHVDSEGYWHIYKNGVLWWEPTKKMTLPSTGSNGYGMMIGSSDGYSINNAVITGMRVY